MREQAELSNAEKSQIEKNIRRSLIELLEKRPYKKINVSDIAAHADIARQTFYCYFRSKDELLLSFMDEIYDEFYQDIEEFIAIDINSINMINEKIYTIWSRESRMAKKILTAGLDAQIYSRFRRYVARGMGRTMIKLDLQVIEPKLLEYYIDLVAGSTFHVMKHWIEDDMPYSPEEMSKIYIYFNNSDIMSAFSAPKL